MEWKNVGTLVGGIAPTLGTILFGPAGAVGGQILASVLGTEATPSAVSNAIQKGGEAVSTALAQAEAEAVAKWLALASIAQAQAEVGKAQVAAVNETIRAEAARPDGWWGHWRTWLAYELVLECPAWAALIVYSILYGKANELASATGLIMTWWAARFGVLGVHVWTDSNERQAAMTGTTTSVIGNLVKTVTRRR